MLNENSVSESEVSKNMHNNRFLVIKTKRLAISAIIGSHAIS
jgi:hypothetical protein